MCGLMKRYYRHCFLLHKAMGWNLSVQFQYRYKMGKLSSKTPIFCIENSAEHLSKWENSLVRLVALSRPHALSPVIGEGHLDALLAQVPGLGSHSVQACAGGACHRVPEGVLGELIKGGLNKHAHFIADVRGQTCRETKPVKRHAAFSPYAGWTSGALAEEHQQHTANKMETVTITIYFIHPSWKLKLSFDRTTKNISQ